MGNNHSLIFCWPAHNEATKGKIKKNNTTMKYRPQRALLRIRRRLLSSSAKELFSLPCFRSLRLDTSETPDDSQIRDIVDILERLQVVNRLNIVEYLCGVSLPLAAASRLGIWMESLPLLCWLDLRGCRSVFDCDAVLNGIKEPQRLKRLYLPYWSATRQSTLDRFAFLEELDVSRSLYSVLFVRFGTLRVLYADDCPKLADEGLQGATRLKYYTLLVSNR